MYCSLAEAEDLEVRGPDASTEMSTWATRLEARVSRLHDSHVLSIMCEQVPQALLPSGSCQRSFKCGRKRSSCGDAGGVRHSAPHVFLADSKVDKTRQVAHPFPPAVPRANTAISRARKTLVPHFWIRLFRVPDLSLGFIV